MKRMICLCFAVFLLFSVSSAGAEGCVLGDCPLCSSSRDCPTCSRCQAVFQTALPMKAACPTERPLSTPRPTEKPASAPRPAATQKPAAQPTAKPENSPASGTGDYTTLSSSAQEQKLLNLLNQDRNRNGLPSLPLDAELSRIARAKSCDMRDKGYFAHESPTWGNAAAMLTAFGYAYNGVGENIAHHASVEKAEAAFLSSTGHRINMMGSQWKKVGIGVCFDANGFVYVTELFVR